MTKASEFIKELKRRRVYRAAVAYIVVGLGVLGGADVVLDPLGLGEARRLIVVLTLLGFPLAMVLAWIYDLTPTGLLRDSGLDDGTEESMAEASKPASQNVSDGIVVLPFENLSPHKEDEYSSSSGSYADRALDKFQPAAAAKSTTNAAAPPWPADPVSTRSPTSQALSQSGRPDSNRRPPEPHSGALPSCATSREGGNIEGGQKGLKNDESR